MIRSLIIFLYLCIVSCDNQDSLSSKTNDAIGSDYCSVAQNVDDSTFPKTLKFGAATSAYQIEGAWNEDGRSPSIWDTGTHTRPERIADRSNGDIAADSYNNYLHDVAALKEVGFDFYRFSISWSRILPTGEIQSINKQGLSYYHKLIDALLKNGIEPMVTMHHYDTPSVLQQFGGLTNPIIADYFEVYADVLYQHFGDKVKTWITFNEPFDLCVSGYGTAYFPPFVNTSGVGEYLCAQNVLLSHARAYHLYQRKYKKSQDGRVGITLNSRFYYPKDDSVDDHFIYKALQFRLGIFSHPIFSETGGWPPIVEQEVARNSLAEGYKKSRLPEMHDRMKSYIKGTADFFAFNYYTSKLTEPDRNHTLNIVSWEKDSGMLVSTDPKWPQSKANWLYSVPQGLRDILNFVKNEYNNPEIMITENGWADAGELKDTGRVTYLRDHLRAIKAAIRCDGVNVSRYTVWSIIDNFEWLSGYTEKFGLYKIDFDSPQRTRTAKLSAKFMQEVICTRKIPNGDF